MGGGWCAGGGPRRGSVLGHPDPGGGARRGSLHPPLTPRLPPNHPLPPPQVVLVHGDLMRVAVQAIKHEPAQGAPGAPGGVHQALTTTFSFLFAAPSGTDVPGVRPETLEDAADWLLAARQHEDDGYPPAPMDWGAGGADGVVAAR
jgi:hypothetical protein